MIYCPGCGGGLRFDIPTQMMTCEYCRSSFAPESITDDSARDDAKGAQMFDSFVYVCPSCGGELSTTDKTDAIGFCPYCGGSSMIFDKMRREWNPSYIVPFQITGEQCKELYVKHVKRFPLVSKKYRDPALIEGFRGIYMPYWNYMAVQQGHFSMEGKKTGLFSESFYRIDGMTDYRLNGYAHDASLSFEDRISERLAPYDTSMHKKFHPCYLSGFYADIGDVEAKRYRAESRDYMSRATASAIAAEPSVANADGAGKIIIDPNRVSIPTNVTSADRVLYPVWFMSYRRGDQITYAAVNGQTGKVCADLPLSPLKILLVVLAAGAALAAALFVLPSVKANITLAVTALLLLAGMFVLKSRFKSVLKNESGLADSPEVKKFKKGETAWTVITVISVVLGIILSFFDAPYNIISYGACLLLAAEFFWNMFRHIRFQTDVAKRRPPQFNKKGAASDEK